MALMSPPLMQGTLEEIPLSEAYEHSEMLLYKVRVLCTQFDGIIGRLSMLSLH